MAQGLALPHDPQIVVHGKGEGLDDLVEHLPVLPGEAGEHVGTRPRRWSSSTTGAILMASGRVPKVMNTVWSGTLGKGSLSL